jgi:hypothetical protein
MPGFLYYVPTQKGALTQDDLRAAGLSYAFELRKGENPTARGCSPGPDNMIGLVLGQQSEGLGYYPQRQTWRKIPSSPAGAWVGFETATPPGPDDLQRAKTIDGKLVELGDGNQWLIPIARRPVESNGHLAGMIALPERLALDDVGEWVSGGVDPKYREVWEAAILFWDSLMSADVDENGISLTFSQAADAAVAALAANYRVNRLEVSALGLLSDSIINAILETLVDFDSVRSYLKKKAEESATERCSTRSGALA